MATDTAPLIEKIDERIAALRHTIEHSRNLISYSKRLIEAQKEMVCQKPFHLLGKEGPNITFSLC